MSCPVMGETLVLPPGTIPDHVFAKARDQKPEPERRKALEEMIVPLTLAFSRNREDAVIAENLVVGYRDFEASVRAALRYAVKTSNVEAVALLLQYDASFYDFVDEEFMNELVEDGCKANTWECVQLIMKYSRRGSKTLPSVEEVSTGEPERKTLGEGFSSLMSQHAKLLITFVLVYGLMLVANSKQSQGIGLPSDVLYWIRITGSRLPTFVSQALAQAFYMAVSVQTLSGFSGLGLFFEGPVALVLVTLHSALSVVITAQAFMTAVGDAVWSQRHSMTVVKVPKRIDIRAAQSTMAKEDSAKDLDKAKDKGSTANGANHAAMPFGHPPAGEGGGKCPFASMFGGDDNGSTDDGNEVKKEK